MGNNIKMGLQEMAYEGMDWIDMAQEMGRWRTLMTASNELSGFIKCGEFFD